MPTKYTSLCLRLRARALYASNGIHYPPVSEAQVEAAEARLGFQLPSMLRELYTTVANGASFFSPGERFLGIVDENERRPGIPTIEGFVGHGPRPFDAETVNLLRAHPGSYVLCEREPAGFVALAHVGCNIYANLDGYTGRLYMREDHYENSACVGGAFSWCAQSVEEWVARVLALSPCDTSEAKYLPHFPLAAIGDKAVDKGEGAAHSDSAVAPTTPRADGDARLVSQFKAPLAAQAQAAHPREQLRLHLQRVREEIVRQIHHLDVIIAYAQEVGSSLVQDIEQSEALQRLADAEAQIYALEDEARFPE